MARADYTFCRNRVRLFGFLWFVRCWKMLKPGATHCDACGAAVVWPWQEPGFKMPTPTRVPRKIAWFN